MGRKDITLKEYLSDSRRYADLFNGSMFHGKQVIRAEELQDMDTVQTKSDAQVYMERINDVAMKQTKEGNLFAVWVVANQEKVDYSMPVRILMQEALEYDRQLKEVKRKNRSQEQLQKKLIQNAGEFLSKMKKEDRLHPVVTLVVYWGEESWQGAQSLHNVIDFGEDAMLAEELKKLVPEYPLHFLNLSKIHDYQEFRTELRTLLELYDRRNDKTAFKKYLEEHEECRQMDVETYETLRILTNAKELKHNRQREEEKVDMCKAIEDLIADGREAGIKQGETKGRLEALFELVQENLLSIKDAAMKASMTENVFSDEMKKAGY